MIFVTSSRIKFVIYLSMAITNIVLFYEYASCEERLLSPEEMKTELISEHYFHLKLVSQIFFTNLNYATMLVYFHNIKRLWTRTKNNFKFTLLSLLIFGIFIYFPKNLWNTFYVENRFKFTRMSISFFINAEIINFTLISALVCILVNVSLIRTDLPLLSKNSYIKIQSDSESGQLSEEEDNNDLIVINNTRNDYSSHHVFIFLLILYILYGIFGIQIQKALGFYMRADTLDGGTHFYGISQQLSKNVSFYIKTDQKYSHCGYEIKGFFGQMPTISQNLFFLASFKDINLIGILIDSELKNKNSMNHYFMSFIYILLFSSVYSVISNSIIIDMRIDSASINIFISFIVFYSLLIFVTPLINFYKKQQTFVSDCEACLRNSSVSQALNLVYRRDFKIVNPTFLYKTFFYTENTLYERLLSIAQCSSIPPPTSKSRVSWTISNYTTESEERLPVWSYADILQISRRPNPNYTFPYYYLYNK